MPIRKRVQSKIKVAAVPRRSPAELQGLTKNQIISELARSPHGDLAQFVPVGLHAATNDADFFAHLVVWNHVKGQVRDAKVALPVLAMAGTMDAEYRDNALAHIADLRPREFARALQFSRQLPVPRNEMRRLVERYLRALETHRGEWERVALLHRKTLKGLYAAFHVKPAEFADKVLFKQDYSEMPRFEVLRQLPRMPAETIASQIRAFRLPSLVVRQVLGSRLKEPAVLVAVIQSMGAVELISNMKSLDKLGVKGIPAARAALELALEKAKDSKKATLKTSVAADALGDDELAGKLRDVQEKQIDKQLSIDGNWLVAGDKSPSMSVAIEAAKQISAILSRGVKGKVACVFFDERPTFFDVTGKSLDEITQMTRRVTTGSATSIGAAIQYCVDAGIAVDGIAIVSDGEENSMPYFSQAYAAYVRKFGNEPTVYFYWLRGSGEPFLRNAKAAQIDVQVFDLRSGVDYNSLPNLVQTMRTGRYSLYDEIMATDLRRLDEVLPALTLQGV